MFQPLKRFQDRGFSLLEVIIGFAILLIAVLTMVGYTAMVHRAASDGKRQALASMEARSLLEKIRDFPAAFDQAATTDGLAETHSEYLLSGETELRKNEVGRKSAAQFHLTGRVWPVSGEVYGVSVTAQWEEDGRPRKVVLESRMIRTNY